MFGLPHLHSTPPQDNLTELGTVVIVGVGMIGGSLGCGLRSTGACKEVIGVDTHPAKDAVGVGAIDRGLPLEEAVALADLLIFSTPVGIMADLAKQAAPHLKDGAVVTDTGSVTGYVSDALHPIFGSRYVAGHPIAGKEHHGVHAADPELFQGKAVILSPHRETDADAVADVTTLWHWLGAHTLQMSAADHDRVFACVSHLPHLAAFALMGAVTAARTDQIDPAAFAAGGLRDFTRVASADPVMWRDVSLANKDALVEMLDLYSDQLGLIRRAIVADDGPALIDLFAQANVVRAKMITPEEPDA